MIEKLLPTKGHYCVAATKPGRKAPKQMFFTEIDDVLKCVAKYDAMEHIVFLAQASFNDDESRKASNALAVRSFWFDIDCGVEEKYPYDTQRDGVVALSKFCRETGLPLPDIVNSGNGLYAHWYLTEEVPAPAWRATARLLKELTVAYDFEVDQSRTADAASVLRPIGTHNRKRGECKEVKLIHEGAAPMEFADFTAICEIAAKAKGVTATLSKPPKGSKDINSEFLDGIGEGAGSTSDAMIIASKCQQIEIMQRTQGDIAEPLWYACIGVLRHTIQSPEIIHEWSKGHPDYSEAATDAKIRQHEEADVGPTTCAHFGSENPKGCVSCPSKGVITSPITLGRVVKAIDVQDGVEVPYPFTRAEDGLYVQIEDVSIKFYENDLYVDAVSFDESLGYEVLTIKHYLPQEGWKEFTIRTSSLTDVRSAMTAMFDNHVTVTGKKEKGFMTAYLEGYAQKLKSQRKISQLLCQMGWRDVQDDMKFVLGQTMYGSDGKAIPISLAKNIPKSAEAFHSKGDLAAWIETTRIFNKPGMEPLAFAFLAAAFGAPLVKFTGYSGAMVSMLGASGVGKTLVGSWALSTYGKPDELVMHKDDTKNALIGRLGVYGNLPLYIDEVTNIDPAELSELSYRITQGRDKVRYTKDSIEKSSINQWNTLALVSSNSSLVDKLSAHKLDAGAEINRVFEFNVPQHDALNRQTATQIYRTIEENYGLAGQEYIRWLAQHSHRHRDQIDKIVSMLDKRTGAQSQERFWSAVAGCAIYGGTVAKKLGLIEFDIAAVSQWVVETIKNMRQVRDDVCTDCVSILGQFIDDHAANWLIVNAKGEIISEPRGKLVGRTEVGSSLAYISRTALRDYMNRKYGSYSSTKNELAALGALRFSDKKRTLGAGTSFAGAQQVCWVVDLDCPALGNMACKLVDVGVRKMLEKVG